MPKFTTERRVAHAADDMFALVADVESYPQFVPLCESLTVRRRAKEGGREVLIADMAVGYKAIREMVTTRVTLDREAMTIRAEYLEGPFHHLDSLWRFAPEGATACVVTFSIDYEFRSRLLAALMGSMFDRAFRKFAEAFEAQADKVYARKTV
jgi:coenzyme Q-binding protein COQ10